jgi:hypothetical protein
METEDRDALPAGDAKAKYRSLLIPVAEDGMPVANQQHAQALIQAGTARYHESDDENKPSQRMKGKRRARDGVGIAHERSAHAPSFLSSSTTERSRSDARISSGGPPPPPPSAREATLGSPPGADLHHHQALHDAHMQKDDEYARMLEAQQHQVLSFLSLRTGLHADASSFSLQERREVEQKDHELATRMQEEEDQVGRCNALRRVHADTMS